MRKIFYTGTALAVFALAVASCKKSVNPTAEADASLLTDDEKSLVASAGFNRNWARRTSDGNFLIERDILLSKAQLTEMAGAKPSYNFIVADEEHYRTFNLVSVPGSAARTITVSLDGNFPSYYSTALDNALARYNGYGLRINFQRVSSGGEISITGADLGTIDGDCIYGQAAGFPGSNGNPAPGFVLSTSSCASEDLNTVDKVDDVIAHEIGHCIGFRHTDYKTRASCGPGEPGEFAGSIGAVHIPGTPMNVRYSYNSWMMACANGNPVFNAEDVIALNYVY